MPVDQVPLATRLRVYVKDFVLVALVFAPVYVGANYFTDHRQFVLNMYFPFELEIPLVPSFILVYVSMYLVFLLPPFFLSPTEINQLCRKLLVATVIGGLTFLLLPGRLGYQRVSDIDSIFAPSFKMLFWADPPHNVVPSLHVTFSLLVINAISRHVTRGMAGLLYFWFVLIVVSTLLTHQHHIADIVSGMLVALLCDRYLNPRAEVARIHKTKFSKKYKKSQASDREVR